MLELHHSGWEPSIFCPLFLNELIWLFVLFDVCSRVFDVVCKIAFKSISCSLHFVFLCVGVCF